MISPTNLFRFVVFLLINCLVIVKCNECPEKLRLLCHEQNNCRECMLAHSCCHWCYQSNFTGSFRCDFIDTLTQCRTQIEKNEQSSLQIGQNAEFTEIREANDAPSAIQIRPQSFDVVLRKDTPVNLTFTYKAAKNYPLELYFLGDLSYSMKGHLDTLKRLGSNLGKSLENLTKHYKLAFGSFLDKPGMPFIYTDEVKLKDPCRGADSEPCDPTYLFKHSLNFTSETDKFFEQVRNSKISANMDDLDGALEAILQILVCHKQFGWSEYARKIILLSTDSLLHTAGDGVLVGATEVNTKRLCLVNSTGDHTAPLKYDYPSLGQIKRLLREYKVNLIVAVTEDKLKPYKKLEQDILEQEAFVGVLQKNSRNILDLVRTGFYDFIRQVEFSANTSHAPELEVKFFGDCELLGHFNATSGCENVREDVPMRFKLQITLKEQTDKLSEQIVIKEKIINEDVVINVKYAAAACECINMEKGENITCEHGKTVCGECTCDLGWTGTTCAKECVENPLACLQNRESQTCSGSGNCICGKCHCPPSYQGAFCQFKCPTNKQGQICNGNGECFEGVCDCNEEYSGEDCSCESAVDECSLGLSSRICNGRGECSCNQCRCEEGYSGKYCEVANTKNLFCDKYNDFVKDYYTLNKTGNGSFVEGEVVLLEEWENQRECEADTSCSIVYYIGNTDRCFIDYCYHSGENDTVHLGTKNKKCRYTSQAMGFGLGIGVFLAVVLGGIIALIIKKIQLIQLERAEYKRFTQAETEMKEINPLYVSPVSEYKNPMLQ